ncbi:hypothetical protein C0991_001488 [Blastosporella zonata]|nr:hypothetical protein C0991_001488 [Blastosporella zonata]
MLDVTSITDLRSLIGSSAFLPAALAYVRNSSSGNLPLDPGIFQAILQCMVAGDKYLLLHTPEEDVALVAKLAAWTLLSIFDLPTHRAKTGSRAIPAIRSKDLTPPRDPNMFLRSLFLPTNKCDASDLPKPKSRKRRPSFLRPASAPIDPPHPGKLFAGAGHHNSASADTDTAPPLIIAAPQPRPFTHAHTESIPHLYKEQSQPEFPHALVLSGLEHATVREQVSLAQTLTRRQIVFEPIKPEHNLIDSYQRRTPSRNHHDSKHGNTRFQTVEYDGTWNLPDGFILIYVCPWNSRERPNIHRSLLDLFAMSSTIFVQKHVRDALRALPFSSNSTSHSRIHSSRSNPPTPSPLPSLALASPRTPPALCQALPGSIRPRSSRNFLLQPPPIVPKQLFPRDFIVSLQKAAQSAYMSSQLSLYLSDLFSAVRHHPKLDGTFLTARSMNDANALARAGKVLGTDPTGGELLRDFSNARYDEGEDDHAYGAGGQNNSEMYEYIASGSESVTIDVPHEPSHSAKGRDVASIIPMEESTEPLFISEAAIARVVPRAVTHRLRLRDGPSDEVLAGAIFGATFESRRKEATHESGWDTRSTVKDILIEILAEV